MQAEGGTTTKPKITVQDLLERINGEAHKRLLQKCFFAFLLRGVFLCTVRRVFLSFFVQPIVSPSASLGH